MKSMHIGLALLLAMLLKSNAVAIKVVPEGNVPIFTPVVIYTEEGERAFVRPTVEIRDGKIIIPKPVKTYRLADGGLIWFPRGGLYEIFWFNVKTEDQGQTYVKVVSEEPDPTPDPDPDPSPNPNPNPPPSTAFEKSVRDALTLIGNPASKTKVAAVYRQIAEEANTRRDIWKPALMIDEAKQRMTSTLTASELVVWVPFWPKFNDAARALKLDSSDTDAFITMFRAFATILEK